MKIIAAIIVAFAICPAISSAAQETAAAKTAKAQEEAKAQAPVGRLYVLSGNVAVSQGSKTGRQVETSEPVVPGMLIKTGENSSALLKFDDGQIVTMQSATSFQVREYHYDAAQIDNSKIDFVFFEGGVHFVPGEIARKKRLAFSLLTPYATIRGGEAEFALVKVDHLMHGKVLAGHIRITNSAGTAAFKAGESPVVQSSVVLASAFFIMPPEGVFREVLSIAVTPPLIPEPVPEPLLASAPEPVSAPSPEPASPEPAPEPAPEPSPVPVPAPVPEQAAETVPAPVPAPVAQAIAPAPSPVSVPLVSPEPSTAPSPEPASVSAAVVVPAQAAPASCTCTCTVSGK